MKQRQKNLLLAILGVFLVGIIYFYPECTGFRLNSHDMVSYYEVSEESRSYDEQGQDVYWSQSLFSGMPNYTFYSKTSNNFIYNFNRIFVKWGLAIGPFVYLMLFVLIALILLEVPAFYALLISTAFALNAWHVTSITAGHVTKIMALATVFLMTTSLIAYFRRRNLWGLVFFSLALCLGIASSHVQIIYYGAIIDIALVLYFFIQALRQKKFASFFRRALILFIPLAMAVMSNISALFTLQDYSKDTMRGGISELTPTAEDDGSTSQDGGLTVDYAFQWSYDFTEILNLVIPNSKGGSSSYEIKTEKSEFAQAINYPQETARLPMYFGTQPFTSGPNYLGVLMVFLFMLYLFYARSRFRWLLLALSILSIMMSLGSNFLSFNKLLFDYLPFYNKFRTPNMSFSILNIATAIGAGMMVVQLMFAKLDRERLLKSLKTSTIVYAAITVLLIIMNYNDGFAGASDKQLLAQNPNMPLDLLQADRASLFAKDIWRWVLLLVIGFGILWYAAKDKLKMQTAIYAILIISVLDLWTVSQRYFNYEDTFTQADSYEDLIPMEPYNAQLEKDQSFFRVFNTTVSSFNDNYDGYRNSNVGGYSPAKLYRYQDLISRQLSKGNSNAYNMLNTKYIIVNNNGQKMAQPNPQACGNAWFVKQVKVVENADAEMAALDSLDTRNVAVVDKRFEGKSSLEGNSDTAASIQLTNYNPDNMTYMANSTSGGFAVFSEIWYRGNNEWKAYIDGVEATMVRSNYLLRGLHIPAGKHEIVMKFRPQQLLSLLKVSLIFTIMLCIFLGILIWALLSRRQRLLARLGISKNENSEE